MAMILYSTVSSYKNSTLKFVSNKGNTIDSNIHKQTCGSLQMCSASCKIILLGIIHVFVLMICVFDTGCSHLYCSRISHWLAIQCSLGVSLQKKAFLGITETHYNQ